MNPYFLLPVCDQWLLYAPLSQKVAVINYTAAQAIRHRDIDSCGEELRNLIHAINQNAVVPPVPRQSDIRPLFLGIIPTRGCNIGCVYCDFAGPTTEKTYMDPRIAVTAVDWMAKCMADNGEKQLQIHFFGGEPFVAPKIVDIVVHRARYQAAKYGLTPYFDASTNGVFSASRAHFIGDHFGGIVLSLDGPPEFQDKNRPSLNGKSTFNQIHRNLLILKDKPLDLCLRVCITQDSVTHMEEIVQWLCETYQPTAISLETISPNVSIKNTELCEPDPWLFAKHCLSAYAVAEDYGIKLVYSAAEYDQIRSSFCPVGNDAIIVSMDGRASSCYLLQDDWKSRGMDMDVGWFYPDGRVDIDFEAVTRSRQLSLDKQRCTDCFCRWSCAGGCHVNQTYRGSTTEYTKFCIQTRLITAALLLRDMGLSSLAKDLLSDSEAMKKLAQHSENIEFSDSSASQLSESYRVIV